MDTETIGLAPTNDELSAMGYAVTPTWRPGDPWPERFTARYPDGKVAYSVLDTNCWALCRYHYRKATIGR